MSLERTRSLPLQKLFEHDVARYAFGVAMVATAFAVRMLLEPVTGTGAPFVLFFGAVLMSTLIAGARAGIGATLLSVPVAAYVFVLRAGYAPSQAAWQAGLFAADCFVVIYLSSLRTRALRRAELAGERLQLANQAGALACWDLDVATGELQWSPDIRVIAALSEAGVGTPASWGDWLTLIHPDDRDAFKRAHERSLDPTGDGQMRFEGRIVGPDGLVCWLSCLGRTTSEEMTRGRRARQVGTVIDVTERHLREEALGRLTEEVSRREARLRDIVELAPDAFFLADLDARFVDVNQAACHMLGYERHELIGKSILDIVPPEDAARLAEVKAELLIPGRVSRGEWTQKRKDGTFVPVEVSSNILPDGRWQAFARDISVRRRIEDERQVFVSLLENSSDFIGIADASGKPVYVNPAGRRMVGLPADYPLEETTIPEYYPPEERAFAAEVIVKSMTERGRWSGETYFRHWQTGEAIPVSDEHFTIRDPTGERILGMGTVTRDISELRRVAREREQLLARETHAREQAEAANEQLRESEERFRLTIEDAPIGMALVALDGRFVRVNGALCQIVGYTADELLRLRFQDITHPEDLDSDLTHLARLTSREIPRYQLEKRYIRKDGAIVTTTLSRSILRDEAGMPLHYIAQIEDITERKSAEEALRLSEARFSGIISVSADAIISIDEQQRITVFNEGAERIFGYTRSEAIGAPLELLLPERLHAVHRRHVADFAAGQVTARRMGERLSTIMGRRKNGQEFPAEAAISRLHVGGNTLLTAALRDVTAQKQIEKEARLLASASDILGSSLDYDETLATVGTTIAQELADWCIIETFEGDDGPVRLKVLTADPSKQPLAAELEQIELDPTHPELVLPVPEAGRPLLIERLTPGELESRVRTAEHLRLLSALDPCSVMELPLLIHGKLVGALLFISSTPSRIYGPSELPLAKALAGRIALAIENGRLYRSAVRATKLRDEVLGVVAHDLRNPLSTILMQAEALRRTGLEPERRSPKPREVILRAARRMNRLIQDLLDVTRIEARQLGIERANVSAHRILRDSVEAQRELAAAAAIELRLELASDLPDVRADEHRLLQVLENLLGNALKFTAAGGHIVVGAAPRAHEVLFWVADTGSGIAPEGLPHIFDRFWQANRTGRRGAGLGLPITRGIVEAHGGRIWVDSVVGRGTIFFFTIPQASERTEATPSRTAP